MPDLDLVAVGIAAEHIRLAGAELAAAENLTAGALDRACGLVDVVRIHQAKAEMRDAAGTAGVPRLLLEDQDVPAPGVWAWTNPCSR